MRKNHSFFTRKLKLLLLMLPVSLASFSQTRNIKGSVRDDKGEVVPFATVTEIGTRNVVKADASGAFLIKIGPNSQILVSASGHTAQTIAPQGNSVNVVLPIVNEQLTEVIITTALGIKRQAKELGYAATTLNNKTLTAGKAVNVQQALNGKVSGLDVTTTNSGVFETAKINIRGIRSLTGNNQPMLVIDGSPTPLGYLSSIPPDDIQDLTILKSAASAAIYGPDAVNGVIVITTKRGTSKQINVTVNSTVQAARVAFFPKLQSKFGAGAGEVFSDPYGNFGYVPYENQLYGPAFDGSIQQIGRVLEDGSVQTGPYSPIHASDRKNFWNTGLTVQNSISISNEDFYLSIEDASIKGLMPDDQNRRTSFRFNGGRKAGNFSVNYGLNYVLQNYNVVNEGDFPNLFNAYNGSIFYQVLQVGANVPLLSYKDWKNNKFAQYSNYYSDYYTNPYWLIGNDRQKGREDNLIGNVETGYQFLPWLKANLRVNGNFGFNNFENTTSPIVVSPWAIAVGRPATLFANQPGRVANDEGNTSRINFDYFLNGEHSITKDFSFKYIAGGTIRESRAKDIFLGGNNLAVPYLFNPSVRSGDALVPTFTADPATSPFIPPHNYDLISRLSSIYGSIGIKFKDWAYAEVTGRNDWDSRLEKENRSFFYPGVNLSLVLSDAIDAIKNSNVISYAKLRAAYSKSGNVNVGVYALSPTYSQPNYGPATGQPTFPQGFPYSGSPGFTADNTSPNPNLKPEFVTTSEVGFEVGLMKNRVNVEATWFNQQCDNQILTVSQSWTTGYPFGLENAASFKNYGVEMDLSLNPVVKIGKGRIDLKVNATYDNNKVLSTLGNVPVVVGGNNEFVQNISGGPTVANIAVVGMPAFAFQLTDYSRDSLGRVIVDEKTGLPSNSQTPVIKGRTLPLWIIGITPSFTIGNFAVSMTWDYKGGNDFYAGIGADEDFTGISAVSATYNRQRFVFPNSVYWNGSKYVPNTNIQVEDGNDGFWSGNLSGNSSEATNYFASAAAWRLREVNISYTLPPKWLGNGKIIKRLTVSAIGRNLLLFVPKSNQWGDPEFNSATGLNTFGLSSTFQSPSSRLYGGSVTVQF